MKNLAISEYKAMDYRARNKWMNENSIDRIPVFQWGEYWYALQGRIELQSGVQRLTVFDVTDDLKKPLADRANFYITRNGGLIEDHTGNAIDPVAMERDENDETLSLPYFYGARTNGSFAVLLHYFDDFWTLLGQRNGEITDRRSHYSEGELPIQIIPPTPQQIRHVLQQQMDELEIHVDAGGAIGL